MNTVLPWKVTKNVYFVIILIYVVFIMILVMKYAEIVFRTFPICQGIVIIMNVFLQNSHEDMVL